MLEGDTSRPGAAAYLEGALEVSALAQAGAPDVVIVRAVAEAIAGRLGFGTVVLNAYRAASDDFVAAECVGSEAARTALLGTTTRPSDWEPLLESGHLVGGTCFVAAGTLDWTEDPVPSYIPPQPVVRPDQDGWDVEDALFVPLRDSTGGWLGIVSVDEPGSGRRPTDEELVVLGAFCAHLAHTLELAQLRTSDRHRAQALARLAELSASTHLSEDGDAALRDIAEGTAAALGHGTVEILDARDPARRLAQAGPRLSPLDPGDLQRLLADGDARPQRSADGSILCPLRALRGELVGVLRTSAEWFGKREEAQRLMMVKGFATLAQSVMASTSYEALRRSEARKEAMVSSSLDAIVTLDAEGRITDFNPAAESMFGQRASAALGQDGLELMFPPESRPDRRSAARRIDHQRAEIIAHRADGSRFEAEAAAVRTDAGPAMHTVFIRDVTERAEARRLLEGQRDAEHHAATHDPVTGLLNREGLRELADGVGSLMGWTLLKVSLDDLSPVHEGFGHDVGTSVTRIRAKQLADVAASAGPLARTGDHTFAVLCPSTDVDVLAAAMRATAAEPFRTDGLTLLSAVSVGVVEAGDGDTVDDLLRRADVARRRSRRSSGVPTYYRADDDTVQERLRVTAALRAGIDAGELELHYQPLLSVVHREIVGFEALVRWRTADGTLVPPLAFIPVAESTGLIAPIGAWVIGEACRQAAHWRAAGMAVPPISVNVSPHQLAHHDVGAIIATELDVHGLEAAALCVEVTEAALNTAPEPMHRLLADLGEMGIKRNLDDFGADYSSLTRLANLEIDGVKLDRGFLRGVPEDARATALFHSIAQVAKAVGMATTAEGVEHGDQLDELVAAGIDVVQGFLLGRPAPAADAEVLLRSAPVSSPLWVAGIATRP